MSITTGQNIEAEDFITESEQDATPANDAGRVPQLESTGRLSGAFLPHKFGDGSDGNVTISSPTSLTRDMYYNDLTVSSTLTTNGYRIFVAGTLSGSGTIAYPDGNNGAAGAVSPGAGGAAYVAGGPLRNTAGAAGTQNLAGNAGTNGYIGSAPGAGGNSSNSASQQHVGGAAGLAVNTARFGVEDWSVFSMLMMTASGAVAITPRGAGGGAGDNSGNGDGGGGGASGGIVWIAASKWAGTFTIKAIGGNGGASSGGNHGGGGGGGAGGTSIVIYRTKTWTGSYNLAGGTGGAAGGANPGATAGGNGATGTSYELRIAELL